MIGIAVTTYNRNEATTETLKHIKKYMPKDAILVVVDDGSDIVHPEVTYRFEKNQGTPIAKNKCFELLYDAGCKHLFLFDNDCYPIVKDWHLPYINSGEVHLNFTFNYSYYVWGHLKIYKSPNGCMMYVNRCVLDAVGGIDTKFKFYGGWHGSFSRRVFNAGLTSFPFIDVIENDTLFCSMDETNQVKRSRDDWEFYNLRHKKHYKRTRNSSKFHPFK